MLCGSSMSFMEHQVLGGKSPLYGRRTAQLKVEPFDVFDAKNCWKAFLPRMQLPGMAWSVACRCMWNSMTAR